MLKLIAQLVATAAFVFVAYTVYQNQEVALSHFEEVADDYDEDDYDDYDTESDW